MPREVDVASLGSLRSIGEGGEGEVFLCSASSGDVFKRFKDSLRGEMDETGLKATMGLLDQMNPNDRDFIAGRVMWPHTLVRESGRLVGFLMPLLPDEVKCRHGRHDAMMDGLSDWNKLTLRHTWMSNNNLDSTVPRLTETGPDRKKLLQLLLDLAQTFEVLHRNQIVVGDVSGRNILWHLTGSPKAILIDCDGFRREGQRAVTSPKQSPDWRDPHLSGETSINSDLYKLGLAVYRAFHSDGLGYPGKTSVTVNAAERRIVEMATRIDAPSGRPTAAEWVELINVMSGGRPKVPVDLASPRPSPPRPVTALKRTWVRIVGGGLSTDGSKAADTPAREGMTDKPSSRPTRKWSRDD